MIPFPLVTHKAAGAAPSALDPLPSVALPGSRVMLPIQVELRLGRIQINQLR